MTTVGEQSGSRPPLSEAKRALLEQRLRRAAARERPGISRRPPGQPPPLSYAQERLWFMEQFAPGNGAYGSTLLLRLGPDADLDAFAVALTTVAARHESLRMRFPPTADGRPQVVVEPPAPVPLPIQGAADEPAATALVFELVQRPFDLAAGPLLRADAIRVAGDDALADVLVLVDMHHVVTDGWSNEVLLVELNAIYRAARRGGTAELADPVPYGDFAAWQRAQVEAPAGRQHLDYWLRRLAGAPALELPTDSPRPPAQTFAGTDHEFYLNAELVAGLTELARAHRATLFMVLLAGYQVVLSLYGGSTDFTVGSPVAGRAHPDLDGAVGMFINMLPLRADLAGDPTVAELVDAARDEVLNALSHSEVPFERVITELGVVRDTSRPALFQAVLVMQNYLRDRAADAEPELPWQPVHAPATRFELELQAVPVPGDQVYCRLVYNTALFEAGTVTRLAGALRAVLAGMVAAPQARVSELDPLDSAAHAELARWNDTAAALPDTTLPQLLAEQARRTPSAVAVVAGRTRLTYRELDRAANRVAARLHRAGIARGAVVAVCAQRSVELVTGLLGILKAGAAYLPLDPDYPAERLGYMLADAGAAALLARRALADPLPTGDTPVLLLDDAATWAGEPDTDSGLVAGPDDPTYLIYTSGSTGRPKGVLNAHRGVVNRLNWMQDEFRLGPDDVVLQKTPVGFDVSVWEFFWPLLTGARLVLAEPGGHRDPAYLREVIARHGVTTIHFVPSMLAAFLADAEAAGDPGAGCASLRRVVCSGEELPVEVARRCLAALPSAELHNLYGPTEAAIDVTAWRCSADDLRGRSRVPIGRPITNVRIHLLDPHGRELPVGAVGELHIGGVQVALGYHRRPELTAQRFVRDPWGPPGARLYATGDLARRRADGTVEFLGRMDGQVKLRGLRIELGEIEVALREQPGVREAAVAVREPMPGDKRIVAYLVGAADPAALRRALGRRLPDYMVPAAFVPLDALPLSANGKLDRAALPMPAPVAAPAGGSAPETDAEREIAAIWCAVLGLDRVGADDDFFALGGHSLLATQVVARIRPLTEGTGRRVGVLDLFQHPTVRGLAALVEDPAAAAQPRRLLYELTTPVPAAERVRSYICVPYGGGSAVVYQPVADALPAGHSLWSVAIPGHDVGLDEDPMPFAELARRCADEVLSRVDGPLVLYGHCGVGGALVIELARLLEQAGREIERVYAGAVFPFAKPRGRLGRLQEWLEDRGSNRLQANWLRSMGVDMSGVDSVQADRIISNMRRDSKDAEEHFTELLATSPARLRAPIVSVVGERDPITDYYQERFREWRFLTDTAALVVLAEAGHFFLRYRAEDLVDVLTRTVDELSERPAASAGRWWPGGVSRAGAGTGDGPPAEASPRRFAAVSAGQLVSLAGSTLTGWAIPVWIYTTTGSLTTFGLTGVATILPILVATPLAGAVADRYDRRRVILASSCAAAAVVLGFALLLLSGDPPLWAVLVVVWLLSFASTFQRIAYTAAIPQLVPKRYLGHANGIAQLVNGVALLFVPLLAAGLYGAIGLRGILLVDVASYAVAIAVLLALRFPDLMGHRRKETFGEQLLGGARLSWGTPAFRAMLVFYGVSNLLYAVPVLLVPPLVLGFAGVAEVGQVALGESLGVLIGGLAMTVWGGPVRRRMVANVLAIAASGAFVALTGSRASLPVVFAGVFGTAVSLSLANGIYLTVVQTKVPQRFHGRVIAVNQTLTWSTLPIGFLLLVPASGRLEPLLAPDGALADTVGRVIGTGTGRGLGFAYVLCGLGMLVNALVALRVRRLARLDAELPDAPADDLVGLQALAAREGSRRSPQPIPEPTTAGAGRV
ncbi:MAG TPA: amino acid adenylation domain-containing protein [Micromonosporaceae bacterium]|nr:amino acid adenylation domain-containing protein [Micromonosporaceae bacterium]